MLAGTRTRCHRYGFSAGVGAGTARVTRGLPVLCPIDETEWAMTNSDDLGKVVHHCFSGLVLNNKNGDRTRYLEEVPV